MKQDQTQPHPHLFMVRVWAEDLGNGRVEWRGKVQHVTSGEVRYFRDWSSLMSFLQAMLPGMASIPGETPEPDQPTSIRDES